MLTEPLKMSAAKFDIYGMYRKMENEEIILSFRGNINEELLSSVFQTMESQLEKNSKDLRLKKKINNILIECLQNVYHHMEEMNEDEKPDDLSGSAMFLVCQDKSNKFRIITGNHILNDNVEKLKKRIEEIIATVAFRI